MLPRLATLSRVAARSRIATVASIAALVLLCPPAGLATAQATLGGKGRAVASSKRRPPAAHPRAVAKKKRTKTAARRTARATGTAAAPAAKDGRVQRDQTGQRGQRGQQGERGQKGQEVRGSAADAPAGRPAGLVLEPGVSVQLDAAGEIALSAAPRKQEALATFARRLCGDARLVPQLREANGGAGLSRGRPYRVPFDLLSQGWQLKVARKLFPEDRGEATGWRHHARGAGPLQRESLWQLSQWFTGKGENFRAIREYNHLRDDDVVRGAVLVIPSELLRPAFGAALPVPEKAPQLDYGKDEKGDYAIYHLRPGEALYSGVVVRFTGRIYAADVNNLAAQIAARSGIEDVTAIPVGFEVKIPLDLLQPEFLPQGDPRRAEYEAGLRASAQFSNQVQARGLAGITVILDPGHGGHDSGATSGDVWESVYVYDIALRVKRLLEEQTAARALLTTRDGDSEQVRETDLLPVSRRHEVLTSPPYPIQDAVIGVHLRWYLVNSFFRHALEMDHEPQKVVFLSIHADSLHPSLRGAMAYIPAARMRDESYGKVGPVYELRREFQESPRVEFPLRQRVASEGLSRELAKQVIAAFAEKSLPVHPFNPVRDRILRNGGEWVPAVLRYNSVPAKMLLEVCNLNNDLDRKLLQTRAYRARVSAAIVAGLLAYYDQDSPAATVHIARAASAGR